MAGRAKDMMGYETKHARVIGRATSNPDGKAMWALECVCGAVFRATGTDIRRRTNMSCGCRGRAVTTVKDNAGSECRIASCDSKAEWRGLCRACYVTAYRVGVLEKVALPSKPNGLVGATGTAHPTYKGAQTKGERGYNNMHRKLSRRRGRAAEHLCAEGCGDTAMHWSYDGYCPEEQYGNATNDGKPWCPHLQHYQPRCGHCHKGWDKDQDYVVKEAS